MNIIDDDYGTRLRQLLYRLPGERNMIIGEENRPIL